MTTEKELTFKQNGLILRAIPMGRDWLITIGGGQVHIGAAALGICYDELEGKANASVISVPGHREDALLFPLAQKMSKALKTTVCLVAGIHFDDLTPQELEKVILTAEALAERFLEEVNTGYPPKT